MLFFRHPKPLLSTRAVVTQVVARKAQAERNLHIIVVEKPANAPDTVPINARVEPES